ncbi:MAG: GNAT family N-acetyltransferase [Ignavibacteriaceae bacterium]|nr:GNAT family N-acetyltransferase [Ignavibacteriaceae bacterium]
MDKLEFFPVDKSRWKDLEKLFGARGACGGCWCMTWRLHTKEFNANKGEGNKKLLKKIVYRNEEPGVIAYVNNVPAGWCAAAPREVYVKLENSRVLSPIDGKEVWSVSCLFIAKGYRRQGLSTKLLKNVVKFCKERGAKIVEAYPAEPYSENIPAAFAWTGIPSSFERAGFKEAARRSRTRPIMRFIIR